MRILLAIILAAVLGFLAARTMNSIKQFDKDIQDTINPPGAMNENVNPPAMINGSF